MACCNRAEDKALVLSLPSPLLNRFCVLQYEPSMKEWNKWAIKSNVHEDVISFLNFREPLLYQAPSANEYMNFPTPRSWATVSKMINVGLYDCIEGAVGEGAAVEFKAFLKAKDDLPDINKLMESEDPSALTVKASVAFAVAVGLATRCIAAPSKLPKGIRVAEKLSPELTALFITLVLTAIPDTAVRNPGIAQWMHKNKFYLS